jgi:hypothetical protein
LEYTQGFRNVVRHRQMRSSTGRSNAAREMHAMCMGQRPSRPSACPRGERGTGHRLDRVARAGVPGDRSHRSMPPGRASTAALERACGQATSGWAVVHVAAPVGRPMCSPPFFSFFFSFSFVVCLDRLQNWPISKTFHRLHLVFIYF